MQLSKTADSQKFAIRDLIFMEQLARIHRIDLEQFELSKIGQLLDSPRPKSSSRVTIVNRFVIIQI